MRINTRGIVTSMTNVFISGRDTVIKLIRKTVGQFVTAIDALFRVTVLNVYLAIAARIASALPFPALIIAATINLCPKPLLYRNPLGCHKKRLLLTDWFIA